MKSFLLISSIVNAVSLVVLILLVGVQIPSFSMWFYTWQYGVNNTYEVVNMQRQDLHEVTRHIIQYLQGNLNREYGLQIYTIVGGYERPFFSEIEIRHMVDVYDLFSIGIALRNIVAMLFLLSFILILWILWRGVNIKKPLNYFLKSLKYTSVLMLGILATLIVLAIINWHRAFVIFHEIFFNNDYWRLNPNIDLLLNIVPYSFFITVSIFIGVFFAMGLALIFAISSMMLRRSKKSIFSYR